MRKEVHDNGALMKFHEVQFNSIVPVRTRSTVYKQMGLWANLIQYILSSDDESGTDSRI